MGWRRRQGVETDELVDRNSEPDFLSGFTNRDLPYGFVSLHETAGKHPVPLERGMLP
jgi:hypothetical protein